MEQTVEQPSLETLKNLPFKQQRARMLAWSQQYTDKALAAKLGTSVHQIRFLRKQLGIRKGARGQLLSEGNGVNGAGTAGRDSASSARAVRRLRLSRDQDGFRDEAREEEALTFRTTGSLPALDFVRKVEEVTQLVQGLGEKPVHYVIHVETN